MCEDVCVCQQKVNQVFSLKSWGAICFVCAMSHIHLVPYGLESLDATKSPHKCELGFNQVFPLKSLGCQVPLSVSGCDVGSLKTAERQGHWSRITSPSAEESPRCTYWTFITESHQRRI